MKRFYRFRSIDQLLGKYKELEKQEIYFAAPEQLNDPMEGYRELFWNGDKIAWKNLFKHYLLCLEHMCQLQLVGGEKHVITEQDIPIFAAEDNFPTDKYKQLFIQIKNHFFKNARIEQLITQITNRKTDVYSDELLFYLNLIHPVALNSIYELYVMSGFLPKNPLGEIDHEETFNEIFKADFFDALDKSAFELGDPESVKTIFSISFFAAKQIKLIHKYRQESRNRHNNFNLIHVDFPEVFIKKLDELMFPNWYAACFMSDYKNSSIWGYYGDNHKGVCLIFRGEERDHEYYISLNSVIGSSSRKTDTGIQTKLNYGFRKRKFYPIHYSKNFGKIDFFRSLGRQSVQKLQNYWYSDNGKRSQCAEQIFSDEKRWQKKYWENFYRDITVKLEDWEDEKEFRLILASFMENYEDKNQRKLKYDFNDLDGIVFGIKTSDEDKVRILKVIEKKCKQYDRDGFNFYQAEYSPLSGSIKKNEMSILKFKKETE